MNRETVLLKQCLNRKSRINNEWRFLRERERGKDGWVCVCVGWVELDMLTCSRLVIAILRDSERAIGACRVKLTWAKLTWHQLSTVTYPLPHSHTFTFPSPSSTSWATTWETHGGCDLTKEKNKKESATSCTHFFQGGPSRHHGTSKLTLAFGGVERTNVMEYEPFELSFEVSKPLG